MRDQIVELMRSIFLNPRDVTIAEIVQFANWRFLYVHSFFDIHAAKYY